MKFSVIKHINPTKFLMLAVVILLCLVSILLFYEVDYRINTSETSMILAACAVITAVGGLSGGLSSIYLIYRELKGSTAIANAEFLLNLNTEFIKNADITKIYIKLEESLSDANMHDGVRRQKYFTDTDKVSMTYYMTYFEVFSNLLERKLIKLSEINDLFAYRFFLAVHDPEFQAIELVKDRLYYKDIFRLYDQWIKYRDNLGQETVGKDANGLKMVCKDDYDMLIEQEK